MSFLKMKNLTKKLIGIAGVLAMVVPNSVNAFDIKNKGEVIINGSGDVHLSDSYFVDGKFDMKSYISDLDGDLIVDALSWQYTPEGDGNSIVMINNRGMNSREALADGRKMADYFNGFEKYLCLWRDKNSDNYGECKQLPNDGKNDNKLDLLFGSQLLLTQKIGESIE